MASRLPFKTTPQEYEKVVVGDSNIGEIEFPKYWDLTPNERIFIKDNTADIPDVRAIALEIASEIAGKSAIPLGQAFQLLFDGNVDALSSHIPEVLKFQDLATENPKQRSYVTATALIKFRLGLDDWTIENTQDITQIHPKLVKEIAEFAQNEERGWRKDEEETKSEPEAATGEAGNPQTPQPIQTGEQSSGESSTTGPTTPDSIPQTLDSSQPTL